MIRHISTTYHQCDDGAVDWHFRGSAKWAQKKAGHAVSRGNWRMFGVSDVCSEKPVDGNQTEW